MMPHYVRGVINLRGAVVPVLDLAVRFGKAPSPVTKRTCIVIIEVASGGEQPGVGVVVDAVNAVLDIPPARDRAAAGIRRAHRTDFIEGMGKVNGKFVILLEVDRVLSTVELDALERVDASGQAAASEASTPIERSSCHMWLYMPATMNTPNQRRTKMGWLNNMKIGTRLGLGFGSVILLSILLGWIAVSGLSSMSVSILAEFRIGNVSQGKYHSKRQHCFRGWHSPF